MSHHVSQSDQQQKAGKLPGTLADADGHFCVWEMQRTIRDSEEEPLPPLGAHCVVTCWFLCFHKELFQWYSNETLGCLTLGHSYPKGSCLQLPRLLSLAHVHFVSWRNVPAPKAAHWRCESGLSEKRRSNFPIIPVVSQYYSKCHLSSLRV